MTKQIALTNGGYALVDDADFDWLSTYAWSNNGNRHAQACINGRNTQMHALLLECPDGMVIDHANIDGLDNQRHNLRLATRSQNGANRHKPKKNTRSKFKGVTYVKLGRRHWQAQIEVNGRNNYLGVFATEEEAAQQYDAAARKYFGEFARTNLP